MIELHRPLFLFLPLGLGAVLGLWARWARGGVRMSVAIGEARRLPPGPLLRWALRSLAVVSLATVLAGPHVLETVHGPGHDGVAIVVALDVSESMRDGALGASSRLDAALEELRRFVALRDRDLIGLVTFSGDALARVPPSLDRAPLLDALESVREEEPEDGTALGTAIAHAANRLRAVDVRSRVVVVVTDGESNAGALDPLTAAKAAAALGQRLYVIGFGGEGEETLRRVASAGDGRSYRVEDRSALDRAYREIDALERTPLLEASTGVAEVPLSGVVLWLTALLLLVEGAVRASRAGGLP